MNGDPSFKVDWYIILTHEFFNPELTFSQKLFLKSVGFLLKTHETILKKSKSTLRFVQNLFHAEN